MNDFGAREMRFTEILRTAAMLFRKNLRLMVPLSFLSFLPGNVVNLFIPDRYSLAAFLFDPTGAADSLSYNDMLLFFIIAQATRLVFTCLIIGGATYVASTLLEDHEPIASEFMEYSFGRWPRLIVTALLYHLITNLAAFLIVPAIYFGVIFTFWGNIAAITKDSHFNALVGSSRMIKGRFLKALLYTIGIEGLAILVQVLLSTLVAFIYPAYMQDNAAIHNQAATALINTLIEATGALFIMAKAVWFCSVLMAVKRQASQK